MNYLLIACFSVFYFWGFPLSSRFSTVFRSDFYPIRIKNKFAKYAGVVLCVTLALLDSSQEPACSAAVTPITKPKPMLYKNSC
jgi:hypothetical protein